MWAALGGQMGQRRGCFGRLEGTYGDSYRGGRKSEDGSENRVRKPSGKTGKRGGKKNRD